jgi:C4-dicarboxylate transporter DctM subunit
MSPLTVGIILMGVLAALIVLKFPIGFSFLIVGFWGFAALRGFDSAFAYLSSKVFSGTAWYLLTVVPLFVLMGELAFAAGIGEGLFRAGRAWLGQVKGGLVMATTMANAAFGAACGMPTAAVAIFGRMALPEMLKAKTDRSLAAGTVAATAGLSAVIPPSVPAIIYGFLAIAPIHKCLIAGLLPGLVTALVYVGMISIRLRINPSLAPVTRATVTWREKFRSLGGIGPMLAIVILSIGGIFGGIFTPTEAGAVGAAGILIIGLAFRRFNWPKLREALLMSARDTSVIFIIIGGIVLFSGFLALSGISGALINFVTGLPVSPTAVVIFTVFMYLGLGCVLDPFSMMFLTVPLLAPVMKVLGVNLIWWGVLVVKMATIGMITPPVGINCYMLKIVCPELDLGEIFRGAMPFLAAEAVVMTLLIAFPQISLLLPGLMYR